MRFRLRVGFGFADLSVGTIWLLCGIFACQAAEQESQATKYEGSAVLFGPSFLPLLHSATGGNVTIRGQDAWAAIPASPGESSESDLSDSPGKVIYVRAVVSIGDYFPLNYQDEQHYEDGSYYALSSTTTLHGFVVFRRALYIPNEMSTAQYVSLDSREGILRFHGFELENENVIFDRPIECGYANMQLAKTIKGSARITVEGHDGTIGITMTYLGVDETTVIHAPVGTLRKCVVLREQDHFVIPDFDVDTTTTKYLYLAKRIREVGLGIPPNTPLLTRCRVGNRGLPSPGARDAVAESDSIPERMSLGSVRSVTMTFRNIGLLPWHPDDAFRLAAVYDGGPFAPANRIYMAPGTTVLPGEACTFQANFTAPLTPGLYAIEWRMVQDGVEVFGEISTQTISVQGGAALPNLSFVGWDFAPAAPTQIKPGSSLALGTFVQNDGASPAGPFWLEMWGSRTGGLMLDLLLAESRVVGPLPAGDGSSLITTSPLYSIPDGPYSFVFVADRPGQVAESNEADNRAVVSGKRLLVVRPQTNANLMITGFTFGPNPVRTGQNLNLGGYVKNAGTQNSGPFWIEFWGSYSRVYPDLDFFLCDSILIPDLAPGTSVSLNSYTRTLYNCPSGTFKTGVFIDRLDQVNETNEANNYSFIDGLRLNPKSLAADADENAASATGPDLVVATVGCSPLAPTQVAPRATIHLTTRVENRGTSPSGPFWIEFWGSKLGGLSLDQFVADSVWVAGLPAGGAVDLSLDRPLYSIPDGPYTITSVADRLNQVAETNETNNRLSIATRRLLTIRPATSANLRVEGFAVGPDPLHMNWPLNFSGRVRNVGIQHTGPFWIEFWGSRDQVYPLCDFWLCDSIYVADLAPEASVDLSAYPRTLYSAVPSGPCAVICFADRNDLVAETNEADNYAILKGHQIGW